ncbi:hypothetical protein [Cytobacillus massiliigabonensis]|uniref:hypothetical protein n=1 Tax=Cytobacillus massiliigabonensis TaxID=1871011 RepID=UPI000C85A0B8|nr:hypothetical protein [Cytobacillus massiliigabonensis]
MELKCYQSLPDILSIEKIALMFNEVLESYQKNQRDKEIFLKILSVLTERQTMTYKILAEDLRERIDKELCKLWNTDSYDDVDTILYIVVNLGLEKCFTLAKNSIMTISNLSPSIKSEIEDTINEVGNHILNPYHELDEMNSRNEKE